MSNEQAELAPPRCPQCLYDLMYFRAGQHCPECGSLINAPHRSQQSAILVHTARIIAWSSIGFALLSAIVLFTPIWVFVFLPVLIAMSAACTLAFFARARLNRDHCYDQRARDELRLAFWVFPLSLGFVLLFIGADLLISYTQSFN